MATFVEAPTELQKSIRLPADHLAACEKGGIPTAGNAAGNTLDLLNLAGQNAPPPRLPAGSVRPPPVPLRIPSADLEVDSFTARGIVALVFSCVAGILGTAVVAWYGMAQPAEAVPPAFAKVVAESDAAPESGPDLESDSPAGDGGSVALLGPGNAPRPAVD